MVNKHYACRIDSQVSVMKVTNGPARTGLQEGTAPERTWNRSDAFLRIVYAYHGSGSILVFAALPRYNVTHTSTPQVYTFHCQGHRNIRGKHYKSLEFTKDMEIQKGGTCIIGVGCDFDAEKLKAFSGKIRVVLMVADMSDEFTATINPDFADDREIVFRRSAYASPRTLGIRASKSALRVKREMIDRMRHPENHMVVTIQQLERP